MSPPDTRSIDNRVLGDVGTKLVFENERVRVWELDLQPGAKSDVHRHDLDYLIVQIEGDRIAAVPEPDSAGKYNQYIEVAAEPGKVTYLTRGGIETAVNVGKRRYRELLIELKYRWLVLGDILRRHAVVRGTKTAYVIGNHRVTYGAFHQRSNRLARALRRLGVARGDRVAVMANNCVEYPLIYFAVIKLGAIVVPVNARFTPGEVTNIVTHSEAD